MQNDTLIWPTRPNRGVRLRDAWGEGHFGASRGSRLHKGLDIVIEPMDLDSLVIAPCSLEITHIGQAYRDTTELHSIHFIGWNSFSSYKFKFLYVQPEHGMKAGSIYHQGMAMGLGENVAGYHAKKDPKKYDRVGPMINHIHFTVYHKNDLGKWKRINPTYLLRPLEDEDDNE